MLPAQSYAALKLKSSRENIVDSLVKEHNATQWGRLAIRLCILVIKAPNLVQR